MSQEAYQKQGDPTLAVIDILKAAPEMQALALHNITDSYKGYTKTMKWVCVNQSGGTERYPSWKASPRIDLNVYAPERAMAYEIISTALAVLQREQHNYSGRGLRLVAVNIETAPFEASRDNAVSARYVCALRLTIRPAA